MAECKELIPSMCGGKLAPIVRIILCIEFEGLTDLYVAQGSDVDLYDGVKAVDQYGNEHGFTVTPSEMDTSEQGTYVVKYSVGDVTAERNVYVVGARTVLYTDKTLIINELETDIDANVAKHGVARNVYPPLDSEHDYRFGSPNRRYWGNSPVSVEIGSPIKPTRTAYWFYNLTNCTNMDLSLMDTSDTDSMNYMFAHCEALTSLDVSHFDTSNVVDMANMFLTMPMLTTLDVSNFDTSKVTDMSGMFSGCEKLTFIDVSNFDTSKVRHFDTMFFGCYVADFDVSNFDTSSATYMSGMFSGCRALTRLNLCLFDTSKVTDISYMFRGCSALTTVFVSELWTTDAVTSSTDMFASCSSIVGGNGQTYDSAHKDKEYARIDAPGTPGYFTEC